MLSPHPVAPCAHSKAPCPILPPLRSLWVQSRILQLLLSIPDREERAALLPDAFTPAEEEVGTETEAEEAGAPAAGYSCRCEEGSEEEELLSTTPLALLQAGRRPAAVGCTWAGGREPGPTSVQRTLHALCYPPAACCSGAECQADTPPCPPIPDLCRPLTSS